MSTDTSTEATFWEKLGERFSGFSDAHDPWPARRLESHRALGQRRIAFLRRGLAVARGDAEEARDHATHARQVISLPTHAIPGRAELAEELLVAVRAEPRPHDVEVLLVQRQLRAGQAGRACRSLPAARL